MKSAARIVIMTLMLILMGNASQAKYMFPGISMGRYGNQTAATDTIYLGISEKFTITNEQISRMYLGEEAVATGRFVKGYGNWEGNYMYPDGRMLMVIFDDNYLLPKGKEYKLHIPAGSIRSLVDTTQTNDELNWFFRVPASLGVERPERTPDDDSIKSGGYFGFSYFGNFDVEATPGMKAQLLREGQLAREFDVYAEWMDFDYVSAYSYIPETVKYEKGVHYTVVLPAGCVRGPKRPDLCNKEVRHDFVGSYTAPPRPLILLKQEYIPNPRTSGIIGQVKYYYDCPIAVNPNGRVYITECNYWAGQQRPDTVMAVKPYVNRVVDPSCGIADFGQYKTKPNVSYSIRLKNGTFYTLSDNPRGNEGDVSDEFTALESVTLDKQPSVRVAGDRIEISGVRPGNHIAVYRPDGAVLCAFMTDSEGIFYLPVFPPGIYLVRVDAMTTKVWIQ